MKDLINKLLKSICILYSYIYTLNLYNAQIALRNKINTYWLYRQISFIGNNVTICTKRICGGKAISIGSGTKIGYRTIIAAHHIYNNQVFNPKIFIGENVCIGDDSNISCINEIRIKKGVLMGRKVMINDNSHGNNFIDESEIAPNLRPLVSKGKIIIEENVWIGEQVVILSNVHIGKGSIIAAGSIVTKNIPAYSIAAGNPAKVIKNIKIV